jgi:hypothetical protein
MIESMKYDIEHFMKFYHDDSRFISGWGHGYFCEEDGGRLIYDIEKPFEHRCSICGKVYHDYQYNACYVTFMRNEAIVTAVKSAILYLITEDLTYQNISKQIIEFYAEHYNEFVIHAKTKVMCDPTEDVGGAGKIMPQGLNEAIIAIRIINAMELLKDTLDKEWIQNIKEKLYDPLFEMFYPQKMHIHNIPTWLNSTMGVMGLFFGEEKWMKEATENPYNLFEQLEKGVTESGFWYEGSIHYNFFALEGVMNFFVFAQVYDYNIPDKYQKIVINMFDAAYRYAFDNDIFPNPSDGWPNICLKTYSYVYYMAYKAFKKPMLKYLKHIELNPIERARLPLSEPYYYNNEIPLERLLFAADIDELEDESMEERKSNNFEASNCATLRSSVFNVFLKYGHQTTSHAHPDKMNVEIMVKGKVLTKDLSNSGYVSKMCNEWHRKIAAHNTCVVNGKPTDIEHAGTCLLYEENKVVATAIAYPGVTYTRELTLLNDKILDCFKVDMEQEGCTDWFFHFETPVNREKLITKPINLFEEYGQGKIQQVLELIVEGSEIVLENDLVEMKLAFEPGMKAYLAKTYNNPADKLRDTIIIRKTGTKMTFLSEITAK